MWVKLVNPCLSFLLFYTTQDEPRLRSYHCRPDQRKRLHPGPEQLRVPQHPGGGAPLLHSAPAFQRRWAHDPATPSASHALTPHQPSLGIQNKHFWADMDQNFPKKKSPNLWPMCTAPAFFRKSYFATWLCVLWVILTIFIWSSEHVRSSRCAYKPWISLYVFISLWCAADANIYAAALHVNKGKNSSGVHGTFND